MKRSMRCGILTALCLATGCNGPGPVPNPAGPITEPRTFSSFDPAAPGETLHPAQTIKLEQADLTQVLNLYAEVSHRSIIRGANLPGISVSFANQVPMSAPEILQALDTALVSHGVTPVCLGKKYVKVVSNKEAGLESGPVIELRPDQLPDSSSLLMYIVPLTNAEPARVLPVLNPLARLPNSIISFSAGNGHGSGRDDREKSPLAIPGPEERHFLLLRDYSSNVRRMMQVLDKLEQPEGGSR